MNVLENLSMLTELFGRSIISLSFIPSILLFKKWRKVVTYLAVETRHPHWIRIDSWYQASF